ncbi:MAG: hypothetical protein Q4D38_00135 [Planctomycetia bacterium]|nr:hypothetical protein [Planctomycetia bacterium]
MGLNDMFSDAFKRLNKIEQDVSYTTDASVSDPMNIRTSQIANTGNSGVNVYVGTITDTCPSMHAYRVSVPGAGIYVCGVCSFAGGDTRVSAGYSPGDQVIIINLAADQGIILAKMPDVAEYGSAEPRTWVGLSDSYKADALQKSYTTSSGDKVYSPSYTSGSPVNNTDVGEFIAGGIQGTQIFVDPYMAYMRSTDMTGVWAFVEDAMLRVGGHNYQHITAGSYSEQFNDNGEWISYTGYAANSWEPYGYYTKPSKVIKTEDTWYNSEEPSAFWEPENKELLPWYRYAEYKGYPGMQSYVFAAPESKNERTGKEMDMLGLSQVTQLADGFVGVSSAKGISLTKRSVFPAIQKLKSPDDPEGDTADNYDFEHSGFKHKGEPDYTATDTAKVMQSTMGVLDYSTYTSNYKSLYPFLYHSKDYAVVENSEIPVAPVNWSKCVQQLQSKQYADPPETYTRDIDGEEHKFYIAEAGFHLLPDGGVMIHDGYGAAITMSGGNITLTAPGDISIRPGRTADIWAGKDIILKSKKAVDVSSTESSVRIKAERNLEMLGGNCGSGAGVVIESKSHGDYDFAPGGDKVTTNGIVLKSENGVVAALGGTVYVNASKRGSGILLDSGNGTRPIYTASNIKQDYVKSRHDLVFGDVSNGRVYATQTSTRYESTFPGNISCNGTTTTKGSLYVDGYIMGGKHIATKQAESNPYVSPLKDKAATAFDTVVRDSVERITKDRPNEVKDTHSSNIKPSFYAAKKIGNADTIEQTEFSFRRDDELDLTDYRVYASFWQTVSPDAGTVWKEKQVKTYSGEGTYPYPGKKYTEDEDCFVIQPLKLYKNGIAVDRWEQNSPSEVYSEPEYAEPQSKKLEQYRITGA